MALLQAIRHHIERTAKKAGAGWQADCSTEMSLEDQELEKMLDALFERVGKLEERLAQAEEKLEQPDWRERR